MGGSEPYRVALVRCGEYDAGRIVDSMRRALDLIGFDAGSVSGRRVLLKPNMLAAYPPERHVTTNPAFVEAVCILFKGFGADVAVGDSSNGVHPIDEVWNITGIRKAAELAGAEISPFESSGSAERDGIRLSKAPIDADIVVNLPKLKTHGLTFMTGAVKNLFGCVPGMLKASYHKDFFDPKRFADLLVRIAAAIKPDLTLVDAITSMEGNGPSSGDPIETGIVMAGVDVHALDAVMCRLIGLDPMELGTIAAAVEHGHFDAEAPIEILGEPIEGVRPKEFKLPDTYVKKRLDSPIAKFVLKFIWNHMVVRPSILRDRCKKCGLCIKSCPVSAISWRGKEGEAPPAIDDGLCIQCLCCHETCPYKAIDLKRSLLAKFARWYGERKAKGMARCTRQAGMT
jgi:uncharacterized protein (DUF362 family)/Pyruvate/2-oxoacid:ferredoxin oxidoreductase delta subunit